jgi:NAD(P)-dependent dehydrogenase (short-subunit alcohol dehydrogenase family)
VVAAVTRNVEPLRPLSGDRLWLAAADVTDTGRLRQVVNQAFAELDGVDVIVSNAGSGLFGAAEEVTDAQLESVLAVNLLAPMQLLRAAVPHLRKRGGGRFIQVSSSGGQVADPGTSVYNASKFGVEGFVESVALELAPLGISTTLVAPGGIRTAFGANLAGTEVNPAYEETIVGQIRGMLAGTPDPEMLRRMVAIDPVKLAHAILAIAAMDPVPDRVVLGGVAHESVTTALRRRLADLDTWRDLAHSVDADDVVGERAVHR